MPRVIPKPLRLAHFSDIHISANPLGWRRRDYFTKRYAGWVNFRWLGRRRRFRSADEVLAALVAELQLRRPDHLIFSGDATALGFEAEFARASALLGMKEAHLLPGIAVPGNHDYYTHEVAASGLFETHFDAWQQGERVDGHRYPFAQRVGPVWLVGVNSSTANQWTWDASGGVGRDQLGRLESLLAKLSPGLRILVTHYPLCLANGNAERRSHGLRDLKEVVAVAAKGGVCLWLHGHRHHAYHHKTSQFAPFPVICAGSATQSGLWSYNEYHLEGNQLNAVRRAFDAVNKRFEEQEAFSLTLP